MAKVDSIEVTFDSYEREKLGSTYKYTFDITVNNNGDTSMVKIVRFGATRNECIKKAIAQLQEDLGEQINVQISVMSMASKVIHAMPYYWISIGSGLKLRYTCEESSDSFDLTVPFTIPLKQDDLMNMQKLTKDIQEQQKDYLLLNPQHGFKELFEK